MTELLNDKDKELIAHARAAIAKNFDVQGEFHTVGAAVRCSDGSIYTGVNIYSIHGSCAEYIALGAAITDGKREFVEVVAVHGAQGEEFFAPCGNCRQMMAHYMPNAIVIVPDKTGKPIKVSVSELLPYAYEVQ